MTGTARLAVRVLRGLALAALLTLPTIVGAMAQTIPDAMEEPSQDSSPNPCGPDGDEAQTETLYPALRTIPVCLEFTPEQFGPLDGADLPSAQETRAAPPERRRSEAA